MNPVSFTFKQHVEKTKQFGLIAEEVEEIMPDLVIKDKDGNIFSVKYDQLSTLLLAVVKSMIEENKNSTSQSIYLFELYTTLIRKYNVLQQELENIKESIKS